ncbi:hypothetical protein DFH07DRAFT_952652 [Mycena maculata]|uniref:Uncharacterized protein n=1 Tax=Mycena maculata TaxID=230809 RepID=A0AAD7NT80_9AGAR|nr:hypothetical protein DFH07DRAFT_952652 [Mycena maculata]
MSAPRKARGREAEWDVQDTSDWSEWPEELQKALRAFGRAKEWGGEEWEECVRRLIALERAWGFPEKGMLSAPAGATDQERPTEVPAFMRAARRWEAPVVLNSEAGPREEDGTFAQRWWTWWRRAQPPARDTDKAEWDSPRDVEEEEWDVIAKMHGRNGMLMFVGGLFWWGEGAAAHEDSMGLLADWLLAVVEVTRVLDAVLKRVSPLVDKVENEKKSEKKAKAAKAAADKQTEKAGATQGKRKAASSETGKENAEPPRKRTRTR